MKNLSSSNLTLRVALLGLALLAAPAAHADVIFNVNTVDDLIDDDTSDGVCHTSANTCSLRAAIMQANHLSVAAVTRIDVPAGTYVLSIPRGGTPFDGEDTGDLNVATPLDANQSIVISGAGASDTIIDGNQIERVIAIDEDATVAIADLTIRNGVNGISSVNATLTIADCIVEGNGAIQGGGLFGSGNLSVVRSTFRSNVAGHGGGLYLLAGVSVIRDSTIYDNGADNGGGIFVASGTLYVANSTLSSNYANNNGGGIWSAGQTMFYNATVVGNDADHDRDENGGIGGGVYVMAGSSFIVSNTLVASNTIVNAPIFDDCNGFLSTFGWNLLGEAEGCAFGGNGMSSLGFISLNTIGPLQDNGGPTWTHALLAGSEAIDTTHDDVGCYDDSLAPLVTDQRGALRPAGPRCDVGAFEYGAIFDRVFRNGFDG